MGRLLPILVFLAITSCAAPLERRRQAEQVAEESNPSSNGENQTEADKDPEIDGEFDQTVLQPPYDLNHNNIVRIIFSKSPLVTAAREEMLAAQYGLDEFRYNLSRFEPFVEASADVADFPNRTGAFGMTGEELFGIEKETFEGALARLEVGAGYSDFRFDDALPSEDDHEAAGGALVRGRIEQPFFGSRRRQERVIAKAFQESTARKGQLDYLKQYRDEVEDALIYYMKFNYHDQIVAIYETYVDELQALMASPDVSEADRRRVEFVKNASDRERDEQAEARRERRIQLLSSLGIDLDEEYVIAPAPPYKRSHFAVDSTDTEHIETLVELARENNPTFRVLNDAIANAQLQRRQAIDGQFDVTASAEGTHFPVGSESFDDRLNGWIAGGGAVLRLNDRRVLRSTQLKAEAEIRQFRANVRTEELRIRRLISIETRELIETDRNRTKLVKALEQDQGVYEDRKSRYFAGDVDIDQLLDAHAVVTGLEWDLAKNLYSARDGERRLAGSLGSYYVEVGLKFKGDGEGDGWSN